ncbi:MAG: CorA family divalent cation transporter, partial [Anaerolineaceae bacterium]
MLQIYKSTEYGLETLDEPVDGCWINVIDPSTEEAEHVQALGVPMDFLTYPLDVDERPRTEREDDGTMLIVLRIPVFLGYTADVPYQTIPMGIVITSENIITICRRQTELLDEFANGRIRGL